MAPQPETNLIAAVYSTLIFASSKIHFGNSKYFQDFVDDCFLQVPCVIGIEITSKDNSSSSIFKVHV